MMDAYYTQDWAIINMISVNYAVTHNTLSVSSQGSSSPSSEDDCSGGLIG